jgi:23S rRNA (guanine745-N1)-methyltransferase
MNRSILICPVCRTPLLREGKSYICGNRHSYDISKEGYVNLLLANQKQSREPGDSKEMLDARKSFLNKGYYKPLARSVTSLIIKFKKKSHTIPQEGKLPFCVRRDIKELSSRRSADFIILDAGCGEGYYTDYISRNNYITDPTAIYGIDISRDGIKSASKRNNHINFAVAGIYNLPVLESSVDALLNIFAPFDALEFSRVLKDNGFIISVTPGAYHLYEFKKHLYDDVYLNDEVFELPDTFHTAVTLRVKFELNIHNKEDITDLLKMTPYYHKSSPERIESFLQNINELKTTADFLIRVITKNI